MTDAPTLDLAEIKRLAACPFCGGDGIPDVMTTGGAEQHYIRCRSCAAEGPWGNHLSTAVDSWNRREPPAAAEQERDRLRVVAEAVAAVILDERQPDGRGGVWVVTGQAKLTVVADALAALRAAIETPGPGTGRE